MGSGQSPAVPIAAPETPCLPTPALTASTGSLSSSSHGTVSSMPSSFNQFSPPTSISSLCETYGPPSGALLASNDPYALPISGAAAAGPSVMTQAPLAPDLRTSSTPLASSAGSEIQPFTLDEDVKGKSRSPPAAPSKPEAERGPFKKPTSPPADVLRRGEDLGLSLGDFDMLDTLG